MDPTLNNSNKLLLPSGSKVWRMNRSSTRNRFTYHQLHVTKATSNNDYFESIQSYVNQSGWLGYIFNGVRINSQHRKIHEPTTPATNTAAEPILSSPTNPCTTNRIKKSNTTTIRFWSRTYTTKNQNSSCFLNQNKATLQYIIHNPKLLRPADLNISGAELETKVGKSNPPSITATKTHRGNLLTRKQIKKHLKTLNYHI